MMMLMSINRIRLPPGSSFFVFWRSFSFSKLFFYRVIYSWRWKTFHTYMPSIYVCTKWILRNKMLLMCSLGKWRIGNSTKNLLMISFDEKAHFHRTWEITHWKYFYDIILKLCVIHTISMHANKQIKESKKKRREHLRYFIFSHAVREYKNALLCCSNWHRKFLNLTIAVRHVFFEWKEKKERE